MIDMIPRNFLVNFGRKCNNPGWNEVFKDTVLRQLFGATLLTLKCPSEKSYRLCPRGGYPPTPPLKTVFPVEFMHTNRTIDRGHKT